MSSSHSSSQPDKTLPAKKTSSTSSQSCSPKKKKKAIRKKRVLLICGVVVTAIVITSLALFSHPDSSLDAGLAYLEKQEQKEIDELDQSLSKKKRDRMLKAVESGQSSIFTLFNSSLVFGDSRVYGFGSYQFLPWEQVVAGAGYTILNISDSVDLVAKVKPEKMFFSYGINDMGLGVGQDRGENGYAQVYEEKIDELLAVSPNSKIYLNSILPATPEVVKQTLRWAKVDEYNAQIEALCKKRGWTYVDNSKLADGGKANIYIDDGIHLQPSFYPEWASNMIFSDD